MAIKTKSISEWLAANPSVVMDAIQTQVQAQIKSWVSSNGQAITDASAATMKSYMEQNLRPLQDGVYIGKKQQETWGYYMRCEPWQTTNIGITAADADAIVIQYGGYRLGISLDEPDALVWGSGSVQVNQSNNMNSFDGKALTAAIMASDTYKNDDAATYAVAYAYNYAKTHTGDAGGDSTIAAHEWWLPTMGDLALIHQNFETINLALTRIKNAGKQSVSLLQRALYWSSCESSATNAYNLGFSNGHRNNTTKTSGKLRVRPVTAF